jgi:uncharacterized protein (DUF305 family)
VNANMALKLRILLVVIIIPASALAVRNQVRHMTTGNKAMQDPNWAELMKSMQTMHEAMGAAKPSGNDDVDFVNLMLPHHQAAVDMAKAELLHGSDPPMRRLAQEIIADQESEIQLMQLWLGRQRTQSKEPQIPDSQKEQ